MRAFTSKFFVMFSIINCLFTGLSVNSKCNVLFSNAVVGDGPTVVYINIFLRSISKIDDYKMVSARSASHVKY